ncbi:MAG: nucleotide exchange factor GrpE [Crocinitomicaceae bacterium]|nr:nucleotide exchange factor GrpE [Crocinitomicaceae bacterium]
MNNFELIMSHKEENKEEFTNEEQLNDSSQEQLEVDETENQELSADDKYNDLNDRFVRLFAEFDNYRKRTIKEKADIISNANEKLLLDLIQTIDDFERAIENNEKSDDIEAIKDGFKLIYNKLKSTLEAKGLKQMESKGETFDSDFHEAIANLPVDENMKGKVIDDVEKGYLLNEKVIRFAKVVVGQ